MRLNVANRLVYSPHDYPATVYHADLVQRRRTIPNNLPAVWDAHWGYLVTQKHRAGAASASSAPSYQTAVDQGWLQALAGYIRRTALSFAYLVLEPDSGDTGGILQDDWKTVDSRQAGGARAAARPAPAVTRLLPPPPCI